MTITTRSRNSKRPIETIVSTPTASLPHKTRVKLCSTEDTISASPTTSSTSLVEEDECADNESPQPVIVLDIWVDYQSHPRILKLTDGIHHVPLQPHLFDTCQKNPLVYLASLVTLTNVDTISDILKLDVVSTWMRKLVFSYKDADVIGYIFFQRIQCALTCIRGIVNEILSVLCEVVDDQEIDGDHGIEDCETSSPDVKVDRDMVEGLSNMLQWSRGLPNGLEPCYVNEILESPLVEFPRQLKSCLNDWFCFYDDPSDVISHASLVFFGKPLGCCYATLRWYFDTFLVSRVSSLLIMLTILRERRALGISRAIYATIFDSAGDDVSANESQLLWTPQYSSFDHVMDSYLDDNTMDERCVSLTEAPSQSPPLSPLRQTHHVQKSISPNLSKGGAKNLDSKAISPTVNAIEIINKPIADAKMTAEALDKIMYDVLREGHYGVYVSLVHARVANFCAKSYDWTWSIFQNIGSHQGGYPAPPNTKLVPMFPWCRGLDGKWTHDPNDFYTTLSRAYQHGGSHIRSDWENDHFPHRQAFRIESFFD